MVSGASLCLFFVLYLPAVYSYGMNVMQYFVEEELGREKLQVFPSSRRETLGKVHVRRTLDDSSTLTTTTPTIITVPSTFPVSGTPTNPTATPVSVPSTTPVTLTPTTPVSTPVPVTNPVTTPTSPVAPPVNNPVTSYPPPAPVATVPVTNPVPNPTPPANPNAPATSGQSWCVAKTGAPQASLQAALDYACGMGGADCSQIQQGASCYNPNTLQNHASFAFNSYYQKHPGPTSCDFGGAATLVNANPSTGSCNYPSSSSSSSPTLTPSTPSSSSSPPSTPSSSSPPFSSSPPSSSSPMTTTPTSPPSSSGVGNSGFGTPPSALNSTVTPAGTMPGFGGPDSPPSSTSKCLQPYVSGLILIASFAIGKMSLLL